MKVYPDPHMTEADATGEIRTIPVEDLGALHQHVADLTREANAATLAYDRIAWIRYGAIWIPIPFLLLLFKLQLQVWHYYAAGALFLVVALVMYTMDLPAVAKRDRAILAMQRAQQAYDVARMRQREAG